MGSLLPHSPCSPRGPPFASSTCPVFSGPGTFQHTGSSTARGWLTLVLQDQLKCHLRGATPSLHLLPPLLALTLSYFLYAMNLGTQLSHVFICLLLTACSAQQKANSRRDSLLPPVHRTALGPVQGGHSGNGGWTSEVATHKNTTGAHLIQKATCPSLPGTPDPPHPALLFHGTHDIPTQHTIYSVCIVHLPVRTYTLQDSSLGFSSLMYLTHLEQAWHTVGPQ